MQDTPVAALATATRRASAGLLSAFASAFTQKSRLLRLSLSGEVVAPDTLLPHRVSAQEAVDVPCSIAIDCLSSDTYLPLKSVLGLGADLGILLPSGGIRTVSGIVTAAHQRGSDGGFARYRLVVEPATALLAQRHNNRVFQDRSVPAIVSAILDEHIAANLVFATHLRYRWDLGRDYPERSYCIQHNESDLAFISRLLAEEGIGSHYGFGAEDGGEGASASSSSSSSSPSSTPGLHTWHLWDDSARLPQNQEAARIRFHRSAPTEASDTLDTWSAQRRIASAAVSLGSYDYKQAAVQNAAVTSHADQGETTGSAEGLERYRAETLYYGSTASPSASSVSAAGDDLQRYTHLRQQSLDLHAKTFEGASGVRSLAPATWFALAGHPVHDQDDPTDREFLVTALQWEATNNLPPALTEALPGLLRSDDTSSLIGASSSTATPAIPAIPPTGLYRNRFTAVRRSVPVLPAYLDPQGNPSVQHAKPTAPGSITATVTGPAGEEIHTDAMGRIKLQFHWQRQQDHAPDRTGSSAGFDDLSSTWVRVAYPSAGAAWGHTFIPRIGQEVVVSFLQGDIDRPIVTGVVHNGAHIPPTWSAAPSLPNNKTLSGIKSKEYKGGLWSELIFDDSTGEVRSRLSTEHTKSQLNQGYLIHPRTEGKGEPRGEGAELRTDAAAAIRAAQGILISADARNAAQGRQLDRQEALSQLDAAQSLADQLADTAQHQGSNRTETGQLRENATLAEQNRLIDAHTTAGAERHSGHQLQLNEALQNWERGSNTDREAKSGSKTSSQSGGQGTILATAPKGIAITTPASATIATGTNLDQVAQRDTSQTTGRRWIHNVGETIGIFVAGATKKARELNQGAGTFIAMKLIAARGKIQVQAQSDEIELTADQSLEVTSAQSHIMVAAKEHITLTSGGGYIRIQGGNIEVHCPGTVSFKASNFLLDGPTRMDVPMPEFPSSQLGEFVVAQNFPFSR